MDWNITEAGIKGEITFKDQSQLAAFVLQLAHHSDKVAHHADMDIRYNRLQLNIVTHDAASVTKKDYDLKSKVEELLSSIR